MRKQPVVLVCCLILAAAAAPGFGEPAEAPDGDDIPSVPSIFRPASDVLAGLDAASRANALIDLEPVREASGSWGAPTVAAIENAWNHGDFDKALLDLRQLEAVGAAFVPAITWREPIVSQQDYYFDERIGDTRTGANDIHLGFHADENTLFAAVSWGDAWTVNFSDDGGATWQETFSFGSAAKISMAVCGNHAWVSYVLDTFPSQVRMRRFTPDTGAADLLYNYQTVDDISPAVVDDIAMIGNAPDVNTAVYVAVVDGDDNLRTYWDDLDGTSFSDYSPPITNADNNLDFTYAPYGVSTSGYVAYLSYANTSGLLEIWRMSLFGTWDQIRVYSLNGTNNYTAISAYRDTILAVFESDYTNGNGIKYEVSYNHGDSWAVGYTYEPEAGDPEGFGGDVSLHSGRSATITYHLEEGATDYAYHISREGIGLSSWGDPFAFSNYDTMSGTKTEIEYLGTHCVSTYGMLYLGDNAIPYFDLMTPRGFFCDDFESGNANAWN